MVLKESISLVDDLASKRSRFPISDDIKSNGIIAFPITNLLHPQLVKRGQRRPQRPARLVALNLLVQADPGVPPQPVAVHEELGHVGQVGAEEGVGAGRVGARLRGEVRVISY